MLSDVKKWQQITPHPCWCHFVQALSECRLHNVAEKAKEHITMLAN